MHKPGDPTKQGPEPYVGQRCTEPRHRGLGNVPLGSSQVGLDVRGVQLDGAGAVLNGLIQFSQLVKNIGSSSKHRSSSLRKTSEAAICIRKNILCTKKMVYRLL